MKLLTPGAPEFVQNVAGFRKNVAVFGKNVAGSGKNSAPHSSLFTLHFSLLSGAPGVSKIIPARERSLARA